MEVFSFLVGTWITGQGGSLAVSCSAIQKTSACIHAGDTVANQISVLSSQNHTLFADFFYLDGMHPWK